MKPDELKAARLALGLSQQGLAERLRISVGSVSRWERGVQLIPPYLALAMAELARQVEASHRAQE
jgi:transcriptional regulator with XRE-family HTH domain